MYVYFIFFSYDHTCQTAFEYKCLDNESVASCYAHNWKI